MKKFNKNIILFVACIIFVIVGLWGQCFVDIKDQVLLFGSQLKRGNVESFLHLKTQIDSISTDQLSYHNRLMDYNSLRMNFMGMRIIKKENTTIIKADSGSLVEPCTYKMMHEDFNEITESVAGLQRIAEENGAKFLYAAVPVKIYFEDVPPNTISYAKENYNNFVSEMERRNIPFLNIADSLTEQFEDPKDMFFYTDHHWTPYAGFIATKSICEELNERYGFEYDPDFVDIGNYNIKTYEDFFWDLTEKR